MSEVSILSDFLINQSMMLYIILGIVNVLAMVWFIQWKSNRQDMYRLAKKIPDTNLSYIPILGNAHNFIGDITQINKCFDVIYEKKSLVKIWILDRLLCATNQPKHIEILMNHQHSLSKNEIYEFLHTIIGTSIFTAKAKKWKEDRKHISPTFNKINLNGYVKAFAEQSRLFCDNLEEHVGKGFFDILAPVERCALIGICETAMGTKLEPERSDELSEKVHNGMILVMERLMNVFYYNDLLYFNLIPSGRALAKLGRESREIATKIITDKCEERKLLNKDKSVETDDNPLRRNLIDQMLEAENNSDLTRKDVLDNITTFLIVGSDTSARTAALAFVMMGMHPEYQQKLYEEAIDVIGHDRPVQAEDLPKLTYLEMFLKETMRLFPIAANIGRQIEEDIDLGDYVIPKGCQAFIGILNMHRSADLYPDPLKFDPERFSPEEIAKRHPYAYVPFSAGPRFCIGMKYAMMSMKTQIAMAVRKFKFETTYKSVEEIELFQAIVLTAKHGQPVKVTPRYK